MNVAREIGIGAALSVVGGFAATKLSESNSSVVQGLALPVAGLGLLGGGVLASSALRGTSDLALLAGAGVALTGLSAALLTDRLSNHDARQGGRIVAPGPIGVSHDGGSTPVVSTHEPVYSDGVYRPKPGQQPVYDDGVYRPGANPGSIQLL